MSQVMATVRMYNPKNLGDCFLLKFSSGEQLSFVLIDFGSYKGNNSARERIIAENIREAVGAHPLTVVLTHQHKDHLSGFIHARDILDKANITAVWLSYLDDPDNRDAEEVRNRMKQFWDKDQKNTKAVKGRYGRAAAVREMLRAKEGYDLFAETQTGGEAITSLLSFSDSRPHFLHPGSNFCMPGLPDGSVKVYVLGPPRDPELLKKLNPGKEEAVKGLAMMEQVMGIEDSLEMIASAFQATSGDRKHTDKPVNLPFAEKFISNFKRGTAGYNLMRAYKDKDSSWRRIDHDWLSEIGKASLYMDRLTNNSSLVLAFELEQSRKVLLFAGDAQIGNWNSWFDLRFGDSNVTAEDLLSRTVLYKAGHHSSHNATLQKGLDLMNSEELVILIPIDQTISSANHFAMLQPPMLLGYNRKSKGQVLRSDTIFHKPASHNAYQYGFKRKVKDFKHPVRVKRLSNGDHLYIECDIS
jgi:hypothetical protein